MGIISSKTNDNRSHKQVKKQSYKQSQRLRRNDKKYEQNLMLLRIHSIHVHSFYLI